MAAVARISAREFIDAVVDPGSFVSWDAPPVPVDATPEYRAELAAAREKSGIDESVTTGRARVAGRPVAIVACEFAFLAGSIGVAAAERIVTAVERATAEGLPLLASPTSGGTRMQEGTVAFVQMIKIAAAAAAHKAAHLGYLVYLRDPTTGGVFASWGSVGHVTFAQPGALVGFLGPRVYQALYNEPFPEGVQRAENLADKGVIDGVLPLAAVRDTVERTLRVWADEPATDTDAAPALRAVEDVPDVPAWQSVILSRRADRPGVRALLAHAATDEVFLSGTGHGETDSTVLIALARFRGSSCVVFGQDRSGQTDQVTMGPGALREARRAMKLAEELRLPLVLVIDTLGASLSKEAEERGLAPEIARCISDLVTLPVPTVSVLLGQGTGGAALALLPADRVLCAQNGWLAPLPPEGASAIIHRDTAHAPEMAAEQGIRSRDLLAHGIVDGVVAEEPDAATEPEAFARRVGAAVAHEFHDLRDADDDARFAARLARYRMLGLPDTQRT